MRAWLPMTVVVAQLGVLGFMAAEREWVARTGRLVLLRTAPVDPRSPMRGDYVRLDYEIAHAPRRLARDGVIAWLGEQSRGTPTPRDRRVFAELKLDEEGVAEMAAVSDRAPATGLFLRGRVQMIDGQGLRIRYGVEALFLPGEEAKALEDSQRSRAGAPLDVEVAVSDAGLAVIKGYRWEPLGITVTPDKPPRASGVRVGSYQSRPLGGASVELKNHGDRPVAIVVRPEGRSFRLVVTGHGEKGNWHWAGEGVPLPRPEAGMVRLLQPGEVHREHVDLTAPHWFLREVGADGVPGAPVPWSNFPGLGSLWLRLDYVPPARAECAGLPAAELIRHSRLSSRAFAATEAGN